MVTDAGEPVIGKASKIRRRKKRKKSIYSKFIKRRQSAIVARQVETILYIYEMWYNEGDEITYTLIWSILWYKVALLGYAAELVGAFHWQHTRT